MFVLAVVGVIAAIYTLRFVLYQKIGSNAQVIASIINVVQIQILTLIYDFVAFKLTDLENQRNDVVYEDSMIVKLFLFQFVNNYSSFYYLAFIAGNLPVPPGAPLTSQVQIIVQKLSRCISTFLSPIISIFCILSLLFYLYLYLLIICYINLFLCTQGECGYPDCMQALAVNIGIIFGKNQNIY